ncbi:MAG TPA: DUF2231 domain-containing protein [Gammaproteobacteria bacterium]|nr:DUF2231 domain-containing protein [Gammaproteobacteria bacterium]
MQGLRIGGHPLHPALVHFPVVCWTAVPVLDLVYLLTRSPAWWQAGFVCLAVGVAMGLLAMGAGLMDLMAIPKDHPAESVAQRHMLLMGSAWCLYVLVLVLHPLHGEPSMQALWTDFGLSVLGFLVLAAGAYAGARLVYDFGVGRNPEHTS